MNPHPQPSWSPKLIPLPELTTLQIPSHIIEVYNKTHYLIAFRPNPAGIIEHPPALVLQSTLAQHHPSIVAAWRATQVVQRAEAGEISGRIAHLGKPYVTELVFARHEDRGGKCSQPLLPGMLKHWGEVRTCEAHALSHVGTRTFAVCKGCRVANYALSDGDEETGIAMRRGARSNVCADCAERAVEDVMVRKVGMCVCEQRWMCFQCWERDLKELVRLRKLVEKGRCGRCKEEKECVDHAELCGRCMRCRVYGDGSKEDGNT